MTLQTLAIELANYLLGTVRFIPFPHQVNEIYDPVSGTFLNSPGKALDPSLTNPLYIDNITGLAIRKPAPSLQSKLDDLINGIRDPRNIVYRNREKISIALVKMKVGETDPVASDPEFAGWQEQKPYYAASAAKIAVLCAVFQLRNDLNLFITNTPGITDMNDLERRVKDVWMAAGRTEGWPNLKNLFTFLPEPPHGVNFSEAVKDTLKIFSQSNRKISELIRNLGFPYIASVMLASGLYSPSTSGIWLREDYSLPRSHRAVFPSTQDPYPSRYLHNITALAASRFFALMEEQRLISKAYSAEMAAVLSDYPGGCVISYDTDWDPDIKAAKCGFETDDHPKWQHDAFIFENRSKRYVIALMTSEVGSDYPHIRDAIQAIL
jgi:hypothetical protein